MKSANRRLIPLAFLLAAVPFQLARANVIVDHPLDTSAVGEFSNLGPANQQVADDFLLAGTTELESLSWFGRYADPTINVPNPTTFSVRFFEDDGGKPETWPLFAVRRDVDVFDTGLDFNGNPWFFYLIEFSDLTLDPGSYWVSVVEDDPATPRSGFTQWLWADTSSAGLRALRARDGQAWNSGWDINHAFSLTETPLFSDNFESGDTATWSSTVP